MILLRQSRSRFGKPHPRMDRLICPKSTSQRYANGSRTKSPAIRMLTEEELMILDILTRPAPELTTEEREEVKKVAHHLLEKLKKLLVPGWRQKISTRARVKIEIENALDEGLPRAYSKDIYAAKCSAIFEHVYQSYQGEGRSVYAG